MPAAAIPYYTVDDLEHFPEDGNRYELLDGVLLVTPQAELEHQIVATRIAHQLMLGLGDHAVVTAPGAVLYGKGTELQPDVLVVPCLSALQKNWRDIKNHWLAVEIYSPSSRIYDREFKVPEYLRRGVGQVWLVDIEEQTVEVFAQGQPPHIERDVLTWFPPVPNTSVKIRLSHLFR